MNVLGERILHIHPPQRCIWCNRLTDQALASLEVNGSKQLSLSPECWLHGYNEASPRDERSSVVRFVLGYHRNQGQAQILKRVDVGEVPGYRPDNPEKMGVMYVKERAWMVLYTDLEGKRHDVYVVWSFSRLAFLMRVK